jgi:putative hydrolase of the HAD superfamily
MNYRVILFDADGMTIIPQRFSEQIEKDHAIPWEKMKPFFTGPYQQCKIGKADLKEELEKVIADWGWTGTVEELLAYWFSVGSEVNPDIHEIIQELRSKGVRCYLATNQEKYRAAYLNTERGLASLFDGVFASAECGHLKQEVVFFEKAYEKLLASGLKELKKEEVLFVDHEEPNLNAAKTFGFPIYCYHDVASFRKEIVTSLSDSSISTS